MKTRGKADAVPCDSGTDVSKRRSRVRFLQLNNQEEDEAAGLIEKILEELGEYLAKPDEKKKAKGALAK